MTEKAISENERVCTFGEIIHNPIVVRDFRERGVSVIDNPASANGAVVIRSHGVRPEVENALESRAKVIDATCPFVKRAQTSAYELAKECEQVIVVGDAGHAEVEAIVEYAKLGGAQVSVVDDAKKLPALAQKVGVVSQTTQAKDVFDEVVAAAQSVAEEVLVKNTICSATSKRQKEAKSLAAIADAMLVIGGKNSSNTRRLFEICNCACAKTYHIETPKEVEQIDFEIGKRHVLIGITAGASTPSEQIDEVERLIQLKYNL